MSLLCWENEWAKGSELPQAKLNETLVARIRTEYRESQEKIKLLRKNNSVQAYADKYGISVSAMDKAIRGESWSHVK